MCLLYYSILAQQHALRNILLMTLNIFITKIFLASPLQLFIFGLVWFIIFFQIKNFGRDKLLSSSVAAGIAASLCYLLGLLLTLIIIGLLIPAPVAYACEDNASSSDANEWSLFNTLSCLIFAVTLSAVLILITKNLLAFHKVPIIIHQDPVNLQGFGHLHLPRHANVWGCGGYNPDNYFRVNSNGNFPLYDDLELYNSFGLDLNEVRLLNEASLRDVLYPTHLNFETIPDTIWHNIATVVRKYHDIAVWGSEMANTIRNVASLTGDDANSMCLFVMIDGPAINSSLHMKSQPSALFFQLDGFYRSLRTNNANEAAANANLMKLQCNANTIRGIIVHALRPVQDVDTMPAIHVTSHMGVNSI